MEIIPEIYSAALRLQNRHFDLLLLDEQSLLQDGFDLWLAYHCPQLRRIVLVDKDAPPAADETHWVHKKAFFAHPLEHLQKTLPLSVSTGELRNLDLLLLLQYLCLTGAQKKFSLYDPFLDQHGSLLISEQQIRFAQLGESQGPEALHQILRLSRGYLSETPLIQVEPNLPIHKFPNLVMYSAQKQSYKTEQAKEQNILVIDADVHQHGSYLNFFSQFQLNPYLAHTALQARTYLRLKQFDYILLDLSLPDHQGRALLHEIRQQHPHKYLFLLSEICSAAVETLASQVGAMGCFTKPFTVDNFAPLFALLNTARSFRVFFRDFALREALSLLIQGRHNHLLQVRRPESKGRIFLHKGEIIYSQWQSQTKAHIGIQALEEMGQVKVLHYSEQALAEAPGKNMSGPLWNRLKPVSEEPSLTPEPLVSSRFQQYLNALEYLYQGIHDNRIGHDGSILFCKIGLTSRKERHHMVQEDWPLEQLLPLFQSLGIELIFDNRGLLEQIGFGKEFQGQTSRGLKIGDSLKTAIHKYGRPQYFDRDCAIWDHLSVFLNAQKEITSFYYGAI